MNYSCPQGSWRCSQLFLPASRICLFYLRLHLRKQFPLYCFSFHCNSGHFGFIVFFLQFADRFAKPAVLCPSSFPHRVRVMSQDNLQAPLAHHRSSLIFFLLYFSRLLYEHINFPSLFSLQHFPYTLLEWHCLLNLRFLFSLIVHVCVCVSVDIYIPTI